MKKFLSFILMLTFALSAAACTERPNPNTDGNGGKDNSSASGVENAKKLTLSDDMFARASINLDTGADSSVGIVGERTATGTTISDSYFVAFKKDGTFEKIVFTTTITENFDDGTQEIRQEEIDGQAANLYVTEKFIFLSFSKYQPDSSLMGSPSFYSDETTKVFAADRKTGKLYSLNEFPSFEVAEASVIKRLRSGSGLFGKYTYYRLQTENGLLKATELLPNENITVHSVIEDKFDNLYVINSEIDSSAEGIFYVTRDVFKGSDGYCYNISGHLDMDYYDTGKIVLSRRNAAGEEETGDSFYTNFRFDYGSSPEILCVRGGEIFQLGAVYSREDRNAYGTYGGNYFYTQAHIPPLRNPYFINDSIVVGYNADNEYYYYDLSTGKDYEYRGTVRFFNEGPIQVSGEMYSEAGMVLVRTEEIYGTVIYRLVEKDGTVVPEEFSRTEYGAEIFTFQPLN